MAKFYGKIGYAVMEVTAPGVSTEGIIEHSYYGDILSNTDRYETGEGLNDNLTVSNDVSIVADSFAYQNASNIRYVTWMGSKWKVSRIQVSRPRIILSIGDVYNDQPEIEPAG